MILSKYKKPKRFRVLPSRSVRRFVWADTKWLLLWTLMGALMGAFAGYVTIGIIGGLLVYVVRKWQALYVLHNWVTNKNTEHPPEVTGILAELSKKFYQVYKTEMRLREALMTNVRRARESVSALEEAVVLIDGRDRIEWWNPAAEKLLGFKFGDQGVYVLSLVRAPEFVAFYRSGQYATGLKVASSVQSGRFLQYEITPFGDNDKLMIVDDVTRLNQLEQVRKDFIANVSHELKTPLTVFTGYIETFMNQPDLKPAWQRGFGQMHTQAQRMNNIVNDLLMLSRLENDSAPAEQVSIDIPELLSQLFDDAQAYNAEFGHLIHLNLDAQTCLRGSRTEIASAFGNLIFNAIKYTPKGGEIDIHWHDDEAQAVFSVTDNGIGISEEHIQRLTERFYRVDEGRSRATGGTGLGLAIVKHVLHRHGAYLHVTSTVGKGSTFSAVFEHQNSS